MDVSRIDLNLLVAFDALVEERNVTRAGRRLGLTQSATSSALQRLRVLLDDPLFVRTATGMQPTERALELAEPIHRALREIGSALAAGSFDPATARRRFVLSVTDYDVALHMPLLAERLGREAPGVDVQVMAHGNTDAARQVDAGQADAAVGWFPRAPARLHTRVLVEERFVLAMRREHPLARGEVTMERYATTPHLLVSHGGDATGIVDDILAANGLERRVAMTVPHVTGAPFVLAGSDLVAVLPARVAARYAGLAALEVRELAFLSYRTEHTLLWHPRFDRHPAHRWFRDLLADVATAAGPA